MWGIGLFILLIGCMSERAEVISDNKLQDQRFRLQIAHLRRALSPEGRKKDQPWLKKLVKNEEKDRKKRMKRQKKREKEEWQERQERAYRADSDERQDRESVNEREWLGFRGERHMQYERMERQEREDRGMRDEVAGVQVRQSNAERFQNEELAEHSERADRQDREDRAYTDTDNAVASFLERDLHEAIGESAMRRHFNIVEQFHGTGQTSSETRLGDLSKYFKGKDLHYYPRNIRDQGIHVAEPEVAVGEGAVGEVPEEEVIPDVDTQSNYFDIDWEPEH